jgi:GntR family transcriptional regulator/MocR family aminotransferase
MAGAEGLQLAVDDHQNVAKMAGMALSLVLDRESDVPLARQIQGQIERLIREGWLAPGVKLPATRELAQALGVNRTTVALAYEELVASGQARAHVGQGTFVAASPAGEARSAPPAPAPARVPLDWSRLFSRRTHIAGSGAERRSALPGGTRPLVSFAEGTPDSGLFPIDAFRRVLNQVVRAEGATLLQYQPGGDGYPPLRAYLATYLLRFGVEARAEEILVVNGSQQGFDLIARTFVDPGDVVAMEQPTYPRAIDVFRAAGAQLVPVPWDREGPSAGALGQVLERHRPKLFYCQPTAHNPTGRTMTPEAARRVLDVAARHHVPIVEDGFDGSLYYGDRRPLPLRALDRDGLVLYIGTFSKVLFPGLRLGWLVAPPPVVARLLAAKQLADLGTSPLIQAAVHRFCERRLLDRHIARIGREYDRRRAALIEALGRHMPEGVSWTEPRGGFSLLLTLPAGCDAAALLPRALRRGVGFTPGARFFLDGSGEGTVRLSFSSVPARRIDDGVRRLAEAITDWRRTKSPRSVPGPAEALVV